MEAELGLSLLVVFALRPLFERLPVASRVGLALIGLIVCGRTGGESSEIREEHPRLGRDRRPASNTRWRNGRAEKCRRARIWLPGSLAQWFNTWTDGPQMTGSSWSTRTIQCTSGWLAIHLRQLAEGCEQCFLWLKAYGVRRRSYRVRHSPEFWKAFSRSDLFAGCEVLWRQDDTNICRVPGVSGTLAHVVPRDSLVDVSQGLA